MFSTLRALRGLRGENCFSVVAQPRCVLRGELVDDCDFLYGKLGGDFWTFFRHDHHFFQPDSPLKRLAVLRL